MNKMTMHTVYEKPADYPNHWIGRKWELGDDNKPHPKQIIFKTDKGMKEVRDFQMENYPDRLVTIRHPNDDPKIVETWV